MKEIPGLPGYWATVDGKILRGAVEKKQYEHRGYWRVDIITNGRRRKYKVHRLILEAFEGPRPKEVVCRHLDGDKKNNRVGNLAWGTQQDNANDVLVQRRGNLKLLPDEVRAIRALKKAGWGSRRLARIFQVGPTTIKSINNGKTWAWVDEEDLLFANS